jgi:hypothetical protein
MVHEGFYSNRTDFIRTAIRNQLATHADAVKQSIVRHTLELGLRRGLLQVLIAEGGRQAGMTLSAFWIMVNNSIAVSEWARLAWPGSIRLTPVMGVLRSVSTRVALIRTPEPLHRGPSVHRRPSPAK